MSNGLIELSDIKKYFYNGRKQVLKAVDGINLTIEKGETLGLVGESGCGKTTLARIIMRLYKPTEGQILYQGTDIFNVSRPDSLRLCREIQMVFQDPYASLNPTMTIEDIIGEPLDIHKLAKGKERMEKIQDLLQMVGLNPRDAFKFPHELSGGQRQRVGIARALAVEPSFIIFDESVSALDVSIQAQIINLISKLQEARHLTCLFISHDISIVEYVSRRIAVMYMGTLVELAESGELSTKAQHPYTRALLSSIPVPDPRIEEKRQVLTLNETGGEQQPQNSGCVFVPRCPYIHSICLKQRPALKSTGNNHLTACHIF